MLVGRVTLLGFRGLRYLHHVQAANIPPHVGITANREANGTSLGGLSRVKKGREDVGSRSSNDARDLARGKKRSWSASSSVAVTGSSFRNRHQDALLVRPFM
ncbi:hypothetical protein LZ30DRAFT_185913 [Colletotrichum cereale]|nr:hypothetical protein LZ30DRAFT_185913 [Colletotrichum cereale]